MTDTVISRDMLQQIPRS